MYVYISNCKAAIKTNLIKKLDDYREYTKTILLYLFYFTL